MRLFLPFIFMLPLVGCLTGDNYPDQYATEYCRTLFACFEADDIEDQMDYNDEKECRQEVAEDGRDSADWDGYEEGDLEFNADNADQCIAEVAEYRADSSCGEDDLNPFTYAVFVVDISHDDCGDVYED